MKAEDGKSGWVMVFDQATNTTNVQDPAVQRTAVYRAHEHLLPPISLFLKDILVLVVSYLTTIWCALEHLTPSLCRHRFMLFVASVCGLHVFALVQKEHAVVLGLEHEEMLDTARLLPIPQAGAALKVSALLSAVLVLTLAAALFDLSWSESAPVAATFGVAALLHARAILQSAKARRLWREPRLDTEELLAISSKHLPITDERPERLSGPRAVKRLFLRLCVAAAALVGMLAGALPSSHACWFL